MSLFLNCLFVGAGGALGAIARFLLGLLPLKPESGFPAVTLGINVAGALCIGLVAALAGRIGSLDSRLLLFLKVGLCGGFTTFSTFSHETAQLLQSGKIAMGVLYASLSVLLCVGAVIGAQRLVG